MSTTRARAMLTAVPLALMLALTACGSDDGGGNDDGVATVDGSTPDGSDGGGASEPLSEEERYNKLLDYAQCLRDNGLDVEDPPPGEGIRIQNHGDPSQSDAALKACEDKAPPPPPGGPDKGEEREQMLKFAKCMRDNGVEKFKDPKPGQGVSIGPEVAEDPDFQAAEESCNEQVYGGQPDKHSQGMA